MTIDHDTTREAGKKTILAHLHGLQWAREGKVVIEQLTGVHLRKWSNDADKRLVSRVRGWLGQLVKEERLLKRVGSYTNITPASRRERKRLNALDQSVEQQANEDRATLGAILGGLVESARYSDDTYLTPEQLSKIVKLLSQNPVNEHGSRCGCG